MTDRKAPPSGDSNQTPDNQLSDELFDRDYLSESDSEFLAELDRVLSEEEGKPLGDQEMGEVTGLAEPDQPAPREESAELDLAVDEQPPMVEEEAVLEEEPAVPEPAPAEEPEGTAPAELAWEELQPEEDTALDSGEGAAPEPEAPQGDEPAVADGAEQDAMELDWEEPVESMEEAGQASPDDTVEPLAEDDTMEAEVTAEAAASPPAVDEPQPEQVVEPAAEPPEPTPTVVQENSLWSGVVALLAVLGIGIGGAAIWQVTGLEDRVVQGQSVPPAMASAAGEQSAEAALERIVALERRLDRELQGLGATVENLDTRMAQLVARPQAADQPQPVSQAQPDTARIDALEQRLEQEAERIAAEQKTFETGLTERLSGRDQELRQEIEDLRTRIAELDNQLESVRTGMDEAVRELAETTRQPAGTTEKTPAEPAPTAEPRASAAPAAPARTAAKPAGTGDWAVNLASFTRESKAKRELKRLQARDIPAQIRTVSKDGKSWYRLSIPGFANSRQAKAYADSLRGKPGMGSVWIGKD